MSCVILYVCGSVSYTAGGVSYYKKDRSQTNCKFTAEDLFSVLCCVTHCFYLMVMFEFVFVKRTKLLENTERLDRSSKRLEDGYKITLETRQSLCCAQLLMFGDVLMLV